MVRLAAILALAGSLLAAAPASAASDESWTVTSLDWAPYAGADLPKGGAAIQVLREALLGAGVALEVRFRPWERARVEAREQDAIVGYYPAWPAEVAAGFFASQPVFHSPVGLAQRRAAPVAWRDVEDLAGRRLAVVDGYIYPAAFRELVERGRLDTVAARDGAKALEMLGLGRVEAVAIDRHVMRYALKYRDSLAPYREAIAFNDRILSRQAIVLAFADGGGNRRRAALLAEALAELDPQAVIGPYLRALE